MKKRLRKLRELLDTAFITLQALFAVSAIVITEVFDQRNLQMTFIAALLVIIAIDFYILFTSRLKTLTLRTEDIVKSLANRGAGVEFVHRHEFDWKSAVSSARHDVFVSGTTLTAFVSGKDVFAALDSSVKVRFMIIDVMDANIIEGFRRMRYADGSRHSVQRYVNQANFFKDMYRALSGRSNIQFGVADRITPMAFLAVDIDQLSENSMIRVQHYLHESEADQATVSYVVRPGSPVFGIYADQIKVLWAAAKKQNLFLEQP